MLRVGLTGGLGSGKSTAAAIFASHGAHILLSDEIARAMMQPGEAVYAAIAQRFGASVVLPDGRLDRPALARIAFTDNRVDELNAIVHPATIAHQDELARAIFEGDPQAIVIVESALILETKYGETKYRETKYGETKYGEGKRAGEPAWRDRFDKLILVTAPEERRIARFIDRSVPTGIVTEELRSSLEAEAHRRIAQQMPDERKAALCDYILNNGGPVGELEWQVDQLWPLLRIAASSKA